MMLNIVLQNDKVGCLVDILGQEKCFQCLQTEKSASWPNTPYIGKKFWKYYILVLLDKGRPSACWAHVDRWEGKVLTRKPLMPRFAPATLSLEET